MSSFELFEPRLKALLGEKRLSASKMEKLTEIAIQSMEQDTQLVSILYRTHKALHPPRKVNSLYIFDSIARAARHRANKHNMTGTLDTEPGNCATFLLKLEGVLDGLVQDMFTSKVPEAKEKVKKVLDIWTKANTFSAQVLAQLQAITNESGKETPPSAPTPVKTETVPNAPVAAPTPTLVPQASPPVAAVPEELQSTLLALLAQAAGQTLPNKGPHPPNQAFSQQPGPPGSITPSQTIHAVAAPTFDPRQASHGAGNGGHGFRGDFHTSDPRNGSRSDRHLHREHGHDRDAPSGSGQWSGDHHGGRREERSRYGGMSPSSDSRRSRSRSPRRPERGGPLRGTRPYSPPNRPSFSSHRSASAVQSGSATQGKDEFGRDLRAESPPGPVAPGKTNANAASFVAASDASAKEQVHSHVSHPSSSQLQPVPTPNASHSENAQLAQTGADQFDMSAFDFTSPASWEALAKTWQISQGYIPTQEQMFQYVMSMTTGMLGAPMPAGGAYGPQFNQTGTASSQDGQDPWQQWTGNDEGASGHGFMPTGANESQAQSLEPNMVGSGGSMQRVGDKWVFVKKQA